MHLDIFPPAWMRQGGPPPRPPWQGCSPTHVSWAPGVTQPSQAPLRAPEHLDRRVAHSWCPCPPHTRQPL